MLGLRAGLLVCLFVCFLVSSSFPDMCNAIYSLNGISRIVQDSSLWRPFCVSVL